MYVIALPIIILKQLFFTVSAVYKKKKTMINQYIKVNESYRIIIPIISSHFFFLISQNIFQLSLSFEVINNILFYYHIFCDIVLLYVSIIVILSH